MIASAGVVEDHCELNKCGYVMYWLWCVFSRSSSLHHYHDHHHLNITQLGEYLSQKFVAAYLFSNGIERKILKILLWLVHPWDAGS